METATGPLGQGLGNAVGMAMAARRERGLFDPEPPFGESPFDHYIYSIASDGDIEEGVSHEVSSLAGHQKLGNLVVIYDDNRISIEDDTQIAKSEDVAKRYEAYGWHVQTVDWTSDDGYKEDPEALYRALVAAKEETGRPSLISLRTMIGWPAPDTQNTGKAHGAALGADEVAATKRVLGQDPDKTFDVPEDALEHAREVIERGRAAHAEWNKRVRVVARGQRRARCGDTTGSGRAACPTAGPPSCRSSRPARRSRPARPPVTSCPRSGRCCPSCGAARPTSRAATTPR